MKKFPGRGKPSEMSDLGLSAVVWINQPDGQREPVCWVGSIEEKLE